MSKKFLLILVCFGLSCALSHAATIYYAGGDHTYIADPSNPEGDIWTDTAGGAAIAGLRAEEGTQIFTAYSFSSLTIAQSLSFGTSGDSIQVINNARSAQLTIAAYIQGPVTTSGINSHMYFVGNANSAWEIVNAGENATLSIYSTGDAVTGILATNMQNRGKNSLLEFYSTVKIDSKDILNPRTPTRALSSNITNSGEGSEVILRDGSHVTIAKNLGNSSATQGAVNPNSAAIQNIGVNAKFTMESGSALTVHDQIQVCGTGSSFIVSTGSTLNLIWNEGDNPTASPGIFIRKPNSSTEIQSASVHIHGTVLGSAMSNLVIRDSSLDGNIINIGSSAKVTANRMEITATAKGTFDIAQGAQLTLSSGILIQGAGSTLSFNGILNTGNITISAAAVGSTVTIGSHSQIGGFIDHNAASSKMTIHGGVYTNTIRNNGAGASLHITGGSYSGALSNSGAGALMTISGGEFNTTFTNSGAGAQLIIKGGTFLQAINNNAGTALLFENAQATVATVYNRGGSTVFDGTNTLTGTGTVNVFENNGANALVIFASGSKNTLGNEAQNSVISNGQNSAIIFQENSQTTIGNYLNFSGSGSSGHIMAGATVTIGRRLQISGNNAVVTVSGKLSFTDLELTGNGVTGQQLYFKDGSTTTISGHFFGNRSNTADGIATVFVGSGSLVTAQSNFIVAGNDDGRTHTGIINQSGGTLHLAQGNLRLTMNSSVATGIYNLSGGILKVDSTAGSSLGITYGNSGRRVDGAGSGGEFNWTAGTLATSRIDIHLANTGSGKLAVGGIDTVGTFQLATNSGHASSFNNAIGGGLVYTQGSLASAIFDVDSATSYDKINWHNGSAYTGSDKSTVILHAGTTFELNVAADLFGQILTLELVNADVITIVGSATDLILYVNGILVDNATWDYDISQTDQHTLSVTFTVVPEPALSAGLLGLLALMAAARRRR